MHSRSIVFASAAAVCLALSPAAWAGGAFEASLRTGFTLPLGNVTGPDSNGKSNSLSDSVTGFIPLWLDLGWRINQNFYLGAYGQLGLGLTKNCPTASCSSADLFIGIDGQYHLLPKESMDPWFGLGLGVETFGVSTNDNAGHFGTENASGFQALLQGGLDFKLNNAFHAGPFLSLSFSQYTTLSASENGSGTSTNDIQNTALHELFTIGVRGTFDVPSLSN